MKKELVMKYLVPTLCLILGLLCGCNSEEGPPSPQEEPKEPSTAPAADESASEGGDVTAKEVGREVDEATEALEQYTSQKAEEALGQAQTTLDGMKQNKRLSLAIGRSPW
jgi:hypothetical protein